MSSGSVSSTFPPFTTQGEFRRQSDPWPPRYESPAAYRSPSSHRAGIPFDDYPPDRAGPSYRDDHSNALRRQPSWNSWRSEVPRHQSRSLSPSEWYERRRPSSDLDVSNRHDTWSSYGGQAHSTARPTPTSSASYERDYPMPSFHEPSTIRKPYHYDNFTRSEDTRLSPNHRSTASREPTTGRVNYTSNRGRYRHPLVEQPYTRPRARAYPHIYQNDWSHNQGHDLSSPGIIRSRDPYPGTQRRFTTTSPHRSRRGDSRSRSPIARSSRPPIAPERSHGSPTRYRSLSTSESPGSHRRVDFLPYEEPYVPPRIKEEPRSPSVSSSISHRRPSDTMDQRPISRVSDKEISPVVPQQPLRSESMTSQRAQASRDGRASEADRPSRDGAHLEQSYRENEWRNVLASIPFRRSRTTSGSTSIASSRDGELRPRRSTAGPPTCKEPDTVQPNPNNVVAQEAKSASPIQLPNTVSEAEERLSSVSRSESVGTNDQQVPKMTPPVAQEQVVIQGETLKSLSPTEVQEDVQMPMAGASLRDCLQTVVVTRLRCDRQTREERVNPVLLTNLSRAAPPFTGPQSTSEELIRESFEGEHLEKRAKSFETIKAPLLKTLSERDVSISSKIQDLQQQYLHHYRLWVANCSFLDNLNKTLPPEEVTPVSSGRNTRRSALLSDAVRSDLEFEQIVASLGIDDATDPDQLATRNLATIPDMISVTRGKVDYVYDDTNHCVEDPPLFFAPDTGIHDWTEEEREIFLRTFAAYPKQFGTIAEKLTKKTTSQCVAYYYLHKKLPEFRKALTQYVPARRRGKRAEKPRRHGLLADIRQHDAQVALSNKPGSHRKRITVSGRTRGSVASAEATPNSNSTSTPTPDSESRPKSRRRGHLPQKSILLTKRLKRMPTFEFLRHDTTSDSDTLLEALSDTPRARKQLPGAHSRPKRREFVDEVSPIPAQGSDMVLDPPSDTPRSRKQLPRVRPRPNWRESVDGVSPIPAQGSVRPAAVKEPKPHLQPSMEVVITSTPTSSATPKTSSSTAAVKTSSPVLMRRQSSGVISDPSDPGRPPQLQRIDTVMTDAPVPVSSVLTPISPVVPEPLRPKPSLKSTKELVAKWAQGQ